MKRVLFLVSILLIATFLFYCSETYSPVSSDSPEANITLHKNSGGAEEGTISPLLKKINRRLAARGVDNYIVSMAEWYTDAAQGVGGQTVYADDRTHRLDHHFVPEDPNRDYRTNITWAVDRTEDETASGLTGNQTTTAISSAMNTWNTVGCASIPLTKVSDYGLDLGVVQYQLGYGGVNGYLADVTHAGWLPRGFFDLLATNGGDFILGVTFTFIWIDDVSGEPTDMDNNRRLDVAFREIYYNDNFNWQIDANFDVESVSLHEMGHGLSLGHFGKIFRTDANGKLHFAPLAVMNAAYSQVQQDLKTTDIASFCSVWSSWPNR